MLSHKIKKIKANINSTADLLGIDAKAFTDSALKQPSLFYLKPETVFKKAKINEFFQILQNKKSDKFVIYIYSDSTLYQKILNFLIKKSDDLKKTIGKSDFIDYLNKANKHYEFTIPQHEVTDKFIQFAKDFSLKHLNKNIFNFKIIR